MSTHTLSPDDIVAILYGEANMSKKPIRNLPTEQASSSKTKRLRSILDALAAVCLYERQHQAFAVSLSINQGETPGVTLYVSMQDGPVPLCVVDHLLDIRARLAHIRDLSEQPSVEPLYSTQLENATADLEISLCLHSYEKLRHRFMKGYDIVSDPKYAEFVASNPDTTPEEHTLFEDLLIQLAKLQEVMAGDARPDYAMGKVAAEVISHLWTKWKPILEGDSEMMALWDINFLTSLQTYLNKLFRLHEQFLILSAIATSARFTQFLDGYFEVKVVSAEQKDLVVDLSLDAIGHSLFESGDHAMIKDADDDEVHQRIMYNISNMAKRRGVQFTDRAGFDNLQHLSFPRASVHCECTLLSFHHRNPLLSVINYIGLSKRSCYTCHLYFRAYNQVAGRLAGHRTFSTRSCRDRIKMPWVAPTLSSNGIEEPNSDAEVKQYLVDEHLQPALWEYVRRAVNALRDEKYKPPFLYSFSDDGPGSWMWR